MTDMEHLGQLVGETARAWRAALDRRLRPLGLSGARWLVLLHLARSAEPLTQTAVAERVGIGRSSLVVLLDRMAADGWIIRRRHENDRRSNTVHLTARAQRVVPRIEQAAAELRRELYEGLSAAELQRCVRVLQHIKCGAEAATVPATRTKENG